MASYVSRNERKIDSYGWTFPLQIMAEHGKKGTVLTNITSSVSQQDGGGKHLPEMKRLLAFFSSPGKRGRRGNLRCFRSQFVLVCSFTTVMHKKDMCKTL